VNTTGKGGRRGRTLSEEESALWDVVARAVKPLRRGRTKAAVEKAKAAIAEKPAEKPKRVKPQPPPPMKMLARVLPQPVAKPKPALAPLDRRTKQKLSRGREAIDARIDLHGMRQDEAHGALSHFLRRCQANGAKFVIVVTGKGVRGGEGGERGVLKREVPRWLEMAEFRDVVVGFEVAAIGHGGEGALYVRIRRGRN
jgi:DNA-nicking Smr family endonuclease